MLSVVHHTRGNRRDAMKLLRTYLYPRVVGVEIHMREKVHEVQIIFSGKELLVHGPHERHDSPERVRNTFLICAVDVFGIHNKSQRIFFFTVLLSPSRSSKL